jgi:hypothetical protein
MIDRLLAGQKTQVRKSCHSRLVKLSLVRILLLIANQSNNLILRGISKVQTNRHS